MRLFVVAVLLLLVSQLVSAADVGALGGESAAVSTDSADLTTYLHRVLRVATLANCVDKIGGAMSDDRLAQLLVDCSEQMRADLRAKTSVSAHDVMQLALLQSVEEPSQAPRSLNFMCTQATSSRFWNMVPQEHRVAVARLCDEHASTFA